LYFSFLLFSALSIYSVWGSQKLLIGTKGPFLDWTNPHKYAVTGHSRQDTFASVIPIIEHLNHTEAMNTVLIKVAIVLITQWISPEVPKPLKGGRKRPAQRVLSELHLEGRSRITDVDLVF